MFRGKLLGFLWILATPVLLVLAIPLVAVFILSIGTLPFRKVTMWDERPE